MLKKMLMIAALSTVGAVSYTHLDVYKRQALLAPPRCWPITCPMTPPPICSSFDGLDRFRNPRSNQRPTNSLLIDVYKRQALLAQPRCWQMTLPPTCSSFAGLDRVRNPRANQRPTSSLPMATHRPAQPHGR